MLFLFSTLPQSLFSITILGISTIRQLKLHLHLQMGQEQLFGKSEKGYLVPIPFTSVVVVSSSVSIVGFVTELEDASFCCGFRSCKVE